MFAVGARDRLVGVSDYSDYPEAARLLPRVGGLEVSAERVASLSPDLVLATPEGNAKGPVRALEAAGVASLVVPGGSLDQMLEGIRTVVSASATPPREKSWPMISPGDVNVRAIGSSVVVVPRSCCSYGPIAGGGTFLDDLS